MIGRRCERIDHVLGEHAQLRPRRPPPGGLGARACAAGEAAFPLVILFALNAVDELDRAAFGVLLPEHPRVVRHRHPDDARHRGAAPGWQRSRSRFRSPSTPTGRTASRSLVIGALAWGFFSGMTGLAVGLILLTVARSGSSLGKAVIDPTHNSLIADYYPIETRSRVYSFHRGANAARSVHRPADGRPARLLLLAGACRSWCS